MSTTLSMRLPLATKRKLDALAKRCRRSRSFLAAEALTAYVEQELWQLDEIQAGLMDLETDAVVEHDDVAKWMKSWGSGKSARVPESRKSQKRLRQK